VVQTLAVAAGAWHIFAFLYVSLSRLGYRYELEWLEGASLTQVYRILCGGRIYMAPAVGHISLVYMPLYFYLSAMLAKVTGLSFTPLRIVSFASSLGCAMVIYFAVKQATASKLAGFMSLSLFASAYGITGGWYDIARTDMLSVFFTILAIAGIQERDSGRNAIWSGVFFAAAFLTKQTTLPFFILVFLYKLIYNRRDAAILGAAFLVITGISFALLIADSGRWFLYYTFQLPASHTIEFTAGRVTEGIFHLLAPISPALIIAFGMLYTTPGNVLKQSAYQYHLVAFAGAMGISMLAYLNRGGYSNVFTPAYATFSILLGLGIHQLERRIAILESGTLRRLLSYPIWIACFAQFLILIYNPNAQIPSESDLRAGDRLVERLREADGKIFIPQQNYLALYAGKTPSYHQVALEEFRGDFGSKPMPEWKALENEIDVYLNDPQVSTIVLNQPDPSLEDRLGCFTRELIEYPDAHTFIPVAGNNSRPGVIYRLCR